MFSHLAFYRVAFRVSKIFEKILSCYFKQIYYKTSVNYTHSSIV